MFARTCWKDLCPAGTMLALASRTTAKQCVLCSTAFLNGIHLGFVLPDPWVVVRTHHRSISRIRGIGSPLMETAPICAVPSWVTAIYSWQIQRFKDRSFPGRGPVWSLSQAALQRRGTNVIQRTSIESVKSTARSGRLFSRLLQQCPSPAVQMVALASKIRRSLPIDNEWVAFLLVIVLSLVRRMLHCTQSVRQIQSFSSIQDARNCSSHPHFTDPSDTETLRSEFHFHCQSFPFRHFLSLVSCLTKGTKMLLALQLTSWQGDVSEEIWAVSTGVMSAFCQDMWLFRQSLIGCVLWNANLAAQVALPVVIAFKLLAPAQMASPPELERLLSLVPRVNHCYHQAGKKTPFRVVMVVGDQSTGKSALLQRFVGFPRKERPLAAHWGSLYITVPKMRYPSANWMDMRWAPIKSFMLFGRQTRSLKNGMNSTSNLWIWKSGGIRSSVSLWLIFQVSSGHKRRVMLKGLAPITARRSRKSSSIICRATAFSCSSPLTLTSSPRTRWWTSWTKSSAVMLTPGLPVGATKLSLPCAKSTRF